MSIDNAQGRYSNYPSNEGLHLIKLLKHAMPCLHIPTVFTNTHIHYYSLFLPPFSLYLPSFSLSLSPHSLSPPSLSLPSNSLPLSPSLSLPLD